MTDKKEIFNKMTQTKSEPPVLNKTETDESGRLVVDVYRDKNQFVIQAFAAGVDPNNLEIHIDDQSVSIKGERKYCQEINDSDFLCQECFWGSFSRKILLPEKVDSKNSTAAFKNGVITIKMPIVN